MNSDIDQPRTAERADCYAVDVLESGFEELSILTNQNVGLIIIYCEVNFERGRKNKSLKLNDNLQKKKANDTFSDYR